MYLYLLALLPLALGQNSSVYTVDVGEGGLIFTPNSMTANVGDQVQFNFYPQNHSVAQSNFANPCVPLNNNAIFSGFFPVANGTSSSAFTITINNTDPLWLYCSQGRHCQAGMAMVINPAADNTSTIQAYQSAARSVASTVQPPAIQGGSIIAASSAPNSTSGSGYGSGSGNGTTGSGTASAGSPSGSSTSTSTSTGSTSTATSGAGFVARSGDRLMMGVAGIAALAFGGLLM